MSFEAKILADSLSPAKVRLTTFEITFPRIILAEFNTHRMLSRNSASSRAIPVEKMIRKVQEDPYVPTSWGKNQAGMQAGEDVSAEIADQARYSWLIARDHAVEEAEHLRNLGIHKQLTNRLLEPFLWHTCIVTATEWGNFFNLRCHKDAHPDIQRIATMMRELYEAPLHPGANAVIEPFDYDEWHLPLIGPEDFDAAWEQGLAAEAGDSHALAQLLAKVSVGRCARVSYLTHDGKRDLKADIELYNRLIASGHLSPLEHVARPARADDVAQSTALHTDTNWQGAWTGDSAPRPDCMFFGNLRGWVSARKLIPNEQDILGRTP